MWPTAWLHAASHVCRTCLSRLARVSRACPSPASDGGCRRGFGASWALARQARGLACLCLESPPLRCCCDQACSAASSRRRRRRQWRWRRRGARCRARAWRGLGHARGSFHDSLEGGGGHVTAALLRQHPVVAVAVVRARRRGRVVVGAPDDGPHSCQGRGRAEWRASSRRAGTGERGAHHPASRCS